VKFANFQNFAIAMDESNEEGDKAQLVAFIRGIVRQLNVTDELAALMPVKGPLHLQSYMQMMVQSLDIPT
jgi:hypothetical protein